jgi:hypothetical protein
MLTVGLAAIEVFREKPGLTIISDRHPVDTQKFLLKDLIAWFIRESQRSDCSLASLRDSYKSSSTSIVRRWRHRRAANRPSLCGEIDDHNARYRLRE